MRSLGGDLRASQHQEHAGRPDSRSSAASRLLLSHRTHSTARQRQLRPGTCTATATNSAPAPRVSRPAGAVSPWAPPQQQKTLPSIGYDRNFSDIYSLDQPLGAGSFKTVFVGRHKRTGQRVAVAVIGKDRDGSDVEHNIQRIQREVSLPGHFHIGTRQHPVLLPSAVDVRCRGGSASDHTP